MSPSIDDQIATLAGIDLQSPLDGLEDRVWSKVQARKAAASGSIGVNAAVTLAALIAGLAFGALHPMARTTPHSELGVLSDDGALAPSVRLGG